MARRRKGEIIEDFSRVYYNSKVWTTTFWFGLNCGKCPLDLWIFQEILYEMRPSLVIETGTGGGGSTLFMANIMDLLGEGRIITIDKKPIVMPERHPRARPRHPRIKYMRGSSVSPEIEARVRALIHREDTVMVDLDSAHGQPHVAKELELYSEFVSPGHYLIVEDTNVGHPVDGPPAQMGRGAWEAVGRFLKRHPEFEVDRKREKFMLTHNPRGYLRRLK
jgi:cephalosporin hydroxylase